MSNTAEIGNRVEEDALHVSEGLYGLQCWSDVELNAMLTHASRGGTTSYSIAEMAKELKYRAISGLVKTLSQHIEALVAAIESDYLRMSQNVANGAVTMKLDDALFRHALLSVYANDVRLGVKQLRRQTRYGIPSFSF